jgi:hypothetical protein
MHLTRAEFDRLLTPRMGSTSTRGGGGANGARLAPIGAAPDEGPDGLGPNAEPGTWDIPWCSANWKRYATVPEVKTAALAGSIDWRTSDPPLVTPVKWQGFVSGG